MMFGTNRARFDLMRRVGPDARRIYLDIDDVISDTITSLAALLFELHGRRVPVEAVVEFDLRASFGLSDEELHEFMEAAHREHVLEAIDVAPGAVEVVMSWHEAGYAVDILTGRPPATRTSTLRWLARHGFPHARFECVDKYSRPPSGTPAVALADLPLGDYVLAVEDNLEMAAFLVHHSDATVLLRDRPWNRDMSGCDSETRDRVLRVQDWDEIAVFLRVS